MTNIKNTPFAKVTTAFVAFASGVMMLGLTFVPTASAQTTEELQEQIAGLLAQIATLQASLGGSAHTSGLFCDFSFTRDLSAGSTGTDVLQLQKFLNSVDGVTVATSGTGSAGNETSFFGPATAQAVSAFQVKYSQSILAPLGLTAGTGYWGASSRAQARQLCTQSPAQTPSDSDSSDSDSDSSSSDSSSSVLEGGSGSIDEAEWITSLNNEDVGEGGGEVEVAGLDIEADSTSDIEIIAVALDFDLISTPNTSDDDFNDYAESVSIWFDGEKLAEVDATDFEDDDDFSQTISLDSGAIIRAGERGELVIAVTGVSNLDDASDGARWNVGFENVRFRDGQDAVITDSTTEDIGDDDSDTSTDSEEREFTFEDFAGSTDLTFQIREGDNDDINEARVIEIDDNDETDNVSILRFEIEIEGTSDVLVDDIPVELTSTGTNLNVLVQELQLIVGGVEIGSESVSIAGLTGLVVFDDMGYVFKAGKTYEVEIQADIEGLDNGVSEGNTLKARFSEGIIESNLNLSDLEDESGEDLESSEIKGAAESEAHLFFENAFNLSNLETKFTLGDTSDTSQGVKGVYDFEFDMQAFGADIYVATTTGTTGTNEGLTYKITGGSFPTATTTTITTSFSVTGENEVGGASGDAAWKVAEGDTETFNFTVNLDNTGGTTGTFGVEITSITFRQSDEALFVEATSLSNFFTGAKTIANTGTIRDLDISDQSLN